VPDENGFYNEIFNDQQKWLPSMGALFKVLTLQH